MNGPRCTVALGCLAVPLLVSLWGCDPSSTVEAADEDVASASEALTTDLPDNATDLIFSGSVTIGACRYSAGTAMLEGPPFPPAYIAFVQRTAVLAPLCPARTVYAVFGENSYNRPAVSIAQGVGAHLAFAATQKPNMSGSSPSHIDLARLRPFTLTTIASATLAAPRTGTNPPNANIWLGAIVFTVPGDLIVTGTKVGAIPGELGLVGGGSFQATYADFASANAPDVLPTQVLAW